MYPETMQDWMLVCDSGRSGPIVSFLNSVTSEGDYIKHFDLLLFGKENYEVYSKPQKLNSYAMQLTTGRIVPIGLGVVVATEAPVFSWLLLAFSYDTIGVKGVFVPVGELDAKILDNY